MKTLKERAIRENSEVENKAEFLDSLFKAVTARMNKLESLASNMPLSDKEKSILLACSDEMAKVHIAIKSKSTKGLVKVFY